VVDCYRAQQLSLTQHVDKENLAASSNSKGQSGGGGSFFRKKNALRSKSLGKDHWDSAIFGTYWLLSDCCDHDKGLCCCLLFNKSVLACRSVARSFLCVYLTCTRLAPFACMCSHSNFVMLEFGWTSGLQRKGGEEKRGWFVCSQLPA